MTPATCSPTWAQPSADGKKIFVACNKADEIVEVDRDDVDAHAPPPDRPRRLQPRRDARRQAARRDAQAGQHGRDLRSRRAARASRALKTSTTLAHGVAVSPDSRYAFVTQRRRRVGARQGRCRSICSALARRRHRRRRPAGERDRVLEDGKTLKALARLKGPKTQRLKGRALGLVALISKPLSL